MYFFLEIKSLFFLDFFFFIFIESVWDLDAPPCTISLVALSIHWRSQIQIESKQQQIKNVKVMWESF